MVELNEKENDLLAEVEKIKFLHFDIFCRDNSNPINELVDEKKCSIDKLDMLLETAIFNYARGESNYMKKQKKFSNVCFADDIPHPEFLAYSILTQKCFTDKELLEIPFFNGDSFENFPQKYNGYRNWPAELRTQLLDPNLIKGKCEPLSPLHYE